MMQRGFILLLIFWSVFFFSGNTLDTLQYQLGQRAMIPCHHSKSGPSTLTWLYKKHEWTNPGTLILTQDKAGVKSYSELLRSRIQLLENYSLVIDCLTEEDQGLYWCEVCSQDNCLRQVPLVMGIKKESGNIETTTNVDISLGITTELVASHGSLNHSTTQIPVVSRDANSTSGLSNADNNKTGTEPGLIVVYVASAVLACLILTALLICYFKPRRRGVYSFQPHCYGWNHRAEKETPVVYSSIVIRKPNATRDNATAHDDCVYSEIRR